MHLRDAAVELKYSPVPSPLPLPGSRRSHVCSAASERMRHGERERERERERESCNIQKGDARRIMRAKFVPAGNRDVGSTVTRITPFHGGNDFAGTLERRVRGETWPKVTMLFAFFNYFFLRSDGNSYYSTRTAALCLRCLYA